MKKIAIFSTYVGVVNRGAETFVIELSKELSKYFDVTIYSSEMVKGLEKNIKVVPWKVPKIIKIYTLAYNKFIFFQKVINKFYFLIPTVIEQKYFSNSLKKIYIEDLEKYDLLFPNNGIVGVNLANELKIKNKIPFIYTGHGGIGLGEKYILLSKPDMYIALTEKNNEWALQYTNKVTKIYNGIDLNNFCGVNKIKNKSKKILCVGAFTLFKRQKLLINAVKMLENVELQLIGSGELEEELINYGKKHLGDRVSIKTVKYDEIKDYYLQADLFSLPSIEEPFGIVYLEAMAMNLPIVAPNDENRREIIGDAGILCNVENIEEYSKALIKALEKDWDILPRKQAEKFSWNEIGLKYKEIIDSVIKEEKK